MSPARRVGEGLMCFTQRSLSLTSCSTWSVICSITPFVPQWMKWNVHKGLEKGEKRHQIMTNNPAKGILLFFKDERQESSSPPSPPNPCRPTGWSRDCCSKWSLKHLLWKVQQQFASLFCFLSSSSSEGSSQSESAQEVALSGQLWSLEFIWSLPEGLRVRTKTSVWSHKVEWRSSQ